jgi:PTS system galactitol-specific IIC component
MEAIINFFDYFSNLGSNVMIPIVITLICLIVGLKPMKALRSGMTVGIGLITLNLVLDLIWKNIDPINAIIIEKFGSANLTTIDIGWSGAATLAFSTFIGSFIIPFTILLNVILLSTKLTKTMNIDIWNYWHYAFTGSCVYLATGNMVLGFVGAGTHLVLSLQVADVAAKRIQRTMQTPGITITPGEVTASLPIVLVMEKIYSKLFGKKDAEESLDYNEDVVEDNKFIKLLQTLVQPMFLGGIIGLIFGFGAGYTIGESLNVAIELAALMFLLPRAAKILMEGFLPMGEQTRKFMQKRFGKDTEINVGLDSAILLGLPTTISVGLCLIPVALLLAVILPNNTTLPFGDLSSICYMVTLATVYHERNGKPKFFRTFVTGVVLLCFILPISSMFAPYITEIAQDSAMVIPENAVMVTCLEGQLFNGTIFKALTVPSVPFIGIALCVIISVASIIIGKWLQKKEVIYLEEEEKMISAKEVVEN